MLFNYPKSDINKFYEEVTERAEITESPDLIKRKFSVFYPTVMESVADLRGYIGNPEVYQRRQSTVSFMLINNQPNESININKSLSSGKNLEDEVHTPRPKDSESEEGSLSRMLNDSKSLLTVGDNRSVRRKGSFVKRVKTNKLIPTNFGNQIEVWTDAIYEKYGQNDKLSLEGFQKWARQHKPFIFNFRKYFRHSLWKQVVNFKTNQIFLNYVMHTPFLQDNVEIQQGIDKPTKYGYAALYVDFLFVWKIQNMIETPARILILKNIKIAFDENNISINFSYKSQKYKNLKLKLSKISIWKFWKDTLEKYSRFIKKRQFQ